MTLTTYDHIDESEQLRYVDGELDDAEVEAVERHLAACPDCRDGVDDLAAACDSLTAFLNQADFRPRMLTYRGARSGAWWSSPWAIAAMLVLMFGGVAAPVMLTRSVTPSSQPALTDALPPATAADAVPGPAPRAVAAPADAPVIPSGGDQSLWIVPTTDVFDIEVSSWQSAGRLMLIFEDTDVVSYRVLNGGSTTASINTMRGLMRINTTADAEASHEVRIPYAWAPRVTVRVAGQRIPLGTERADRRGVAVTGDAAAEVVPESGRDWLGRTVTIDLDFDHRPR